MKTLRKLNINSEKLMKNEELITLRGGYGTCYYCRAFNNEWLGTLYGCGLTPSEAVFVCKQSWPATDHADENMCL